MKKQFILKSTKMDGSFGDSGHQLIMLVVKHCPDGIEQENAIDLVLKLIDLYGTPEATIAAIESGEARIEKS